MKKPNPELIDDETPELDEAWFKRAKPAHEVLPPALLKKLGIRGPQKAPTKERITIRLSHDVVERFRSTGDGWQTRVDAALQDWQEDGWFIGHLREVPACFSQGETLRELEQNVAEVYHLLREDSDLPVPPSVMTKAFPIAA